LAPRNKFARLERRVDEICSLCEKLALRVLLFGCFIYEAGKFVVGILR
jgi:hypothetical protein